MRNIEIRCILVILVLIIISAQLTMANSDKTLVIAHRGASAYERENTLEAFQKAIDLNADMVEVDIRKTKDNILIAHHNSRIKGTKIKSLTYKEVQSRTDFHVPTFEEVLKATKGKIKLDADIKDKGYGNEAANLILKYFKTKDFVMTSEYGQPLKEIKAHHSDIKTGLILKKKRPRNWLLFTPLGFFPKSRIDNVQADFIVPDWRFVNKAFLKQAEEYNIPIFIWPVNNKDLFNRFQKIDIVQGIITSNPGLANS